MKDLGHQPEVDLGQSARERTFRTSAREVGSTDRCNTPESGPLSGERNVVFRQT